MPRKTLDGPNPSRDQSGQRWQAVSQARFASALSQRVDDAQKVYHFDGQELDQTRLPGEVDMQLGLGEWRGHFFSPGFSLDLEERALSRSGVLSAVREVTSFAARWAEREFALRGGRRAWLAVLAAMWCRGSKFGPAARNA